MLSARVAVLRAEKGWSQERLANEAGLGTMTVVRVEAGRPCSLGTLEKLAAALGTTAAELLADPPTG